MIKEISGPYPNDPTNVIIVNKSETTILYTTGSSGAYLGYITVQYEPDQPNLGASHQHLYYAIAISDGACPTIEKCCFSSSSLGENFSFFHCQRMNIFRNRFSLSRNRFLDNFYFKAF